MRGFQDFNFELFAISIELFAISCCEQAHGTSCARAVRAVRSVLPFCRCFGGGLRAENQPVTVRRYRARAASPLVSKGATVPILPGSARFAVLAGESIERAGARARLVHILATLYVVAWLAGESIDRAGARARLVLILATLHMAAWFARVPV